MAIVMRFAKHAFTAFLLLAPASLLQHSVASAQVTSPTVNPQPAAPQVQSTRAPHAAAAEPASTATLLNSRSFSIPFTVDATGTQPAKVELYVGRVHPSSDEASIQWALFDVAQPDAQHFQFTAAEDGLYHFTTRTIDVAGKPHSFGNRLDVLINSIGPEIQLTADADDSGRVDVQYDIKDASPVKQVRLQYMTDIERVWKPIETSEAVSSAAAAKLSFTPAGRWDELHVQATVIDTAGNQKSTHVSVQRPRVAALPVHRYSVSTPVAPQSARPAPYRVEGSTVGQTVQWSGVSQPSSANSTGGVTVTAVPSGSAAGVDAKPGFENIPLPSPTLPSASEIGLGLAAPTQNTAAQNITSGLGSGGINGTRMPITPWSAVTPSDTNKSPIDRPRTVAEAMRPLDGATAEAAKNALGETMASSLPPTGMPVPQQTIPRPSANIEQIPLAEDVAKENTAYAAGRAAVPTTIDPRTPLRYSNSVRFSLDYELEAVGSGGVEAVELWGSLDGGKSWKRWGSDPDRQSPFDIETNGEGTYAYRIVVLSSSGLASPRPLSGDTADIAVTVDSTQPDIKITGAKYGEGDRVGSLIIKYALDERHPLPRPIALAFSESIDGPWTTIASGLRNEGEYVWPADPQLPRQFYLRIDATDGAGNVGTHILDSPIDAQGLAPRARIRGLQSISGSEPAAADDQTATLPAGTFK